MRRRDLITAASLRSIIADNDSILPGSILVGSFGISIFGGAGTGFTRSGSGGLASAIVSLSLESESSFSATVLGRSGFGGRSVLAVPGLPTILSREAETGGL